MSNPLNKNDPYRKFNLYKGIRPRPKLSFINPSTQERMRVIEFLQSVQVEGMRKHICVGCPASQLYDKNNKTYNIPRTMKLEEVKAIVEQIKKINAE